MSKNGPPAFLRQGKQKAGPTDTSRKALARFADSLRNDNVCDALQKTILMLVAREIVGG